MKSGWDRGGFCCFNTNTMCLSSAMVIHFKFEARMWAIIPRFEESLWAATILDSPDRLAFSTEASTNLRTSDSTCDILFSDRNRFSCPDKIHYNNNRPPLAHSPDRAILGHLRRHHPNRPTAHRQLPVLILKASSLPGTLLRYNYIHIRYKEGRK